MSWDSMCSSYQRSNGARLVQVLRTVQAQMRFECCLRKLLFRSLQSSGSCFRLDFGIFLLLPILYCLSNPSQLPHSDHLHALLSPTLIIFMLYSHPLWSWSSSCSTITRSDHLHFQLSPHLLFFIFYSFHLLFYSLLSKFPFRLLPFLLLSLPFLFFYLYFIPTFCFTKIDVLIIIFFLKAGRGIGYVPHEIYVHVNAEVKYSSKLKFTF